MTTWSDEAFRIGAQIRGKWNGHVYTVERALGSGSNGQVMLVRRGKTLFALKAGFEMVDHQSEINVLRKLSKTNTSFNQYLVDVDDYVYANVHIPFCVLRFIEGLKLQIYLKKYGQDWIYAIGTNLLRKLCELHEGGYIFGDLKPENMLITGYGNVSLIDFGGVTAKGRSVKQLTEFFDRGYWNAGERTAEDSYDLFSFAILIIYAIQRDGRFAEFKRMIPQNRSIELLQPMIKENARLSAMAPFLNGALQGKFRSSREAYDEWCSLIGSKKGRTLATIKAPWVAVCFAASVVLFGATLFMYW